MAGVNPVASFERPSKVIVGVQNCYKNAEDLVSVLSKYVPVVAITDKDNCKLSQENVEVVEVNDLKTTFSRDWGPLFLELDNKLMIAEYKYSLNKKVIQELGYAEQLTSLKAPVAGGDFQVNSDGVCVVTYSKKYQNSDYYFQKIEKLKKVGCSKVIGLEPAFAEKTKHVDIYFQFVSNSEVVLADYSLASSERAAISMKQNYRTLKELGFNIHLIPQPGTIKTAEGKWVHVSYVNSLVLGDQVFVPQFGIEQDGLAVEAWKKVGLEVISVKQDFPYYDGSIHCLTSPVY
jgi:agmatine/peptidylarginine deiminase